MTFIGGTMLQHSMVLISAGSFEMGDHLDNIEDAHPVHTVELDGFYIDAHPVTVGQFKQFVEDSGYNYTRKIVDEDGYNYSRHNWKNVARYSPSDDHPMVYVNWSDAAAFAAWAGKRLPTEAEWEYAARGGLFGERYPWGNEITTENAHYAGMDGCSQVGSFSPNGFGLYDVAGNVWEWCADWYNKDYYGISPLKNPKGPEEGYYRVARGGSWRHDAQTLRVAARNHDSPTANSYCVGFRCVRNVSGE